MFEDKLKNNEERNHMQAKVKKKEFILGILFDGMLSLPFGEFSDVIWAPLY
jgi:hypothetical protein